MKIAHECKKFGRVCAQCVRDDQEAVMSEQGELRAVIARLRAEIAALKELLVPLPRPDITQRTILKLQEELMKCTPIPMEHLGRAIEGLIEAYRHDKCEDLINLLIDYEDAKETDRLEIVRTIAEMLDPARVGGIIFGAKNIKAAFRKRGGSRQKAVGKRTRG